MNALRWFWSASLVLSGMVYAGQVPPDDPGCPVSGNPVHLINRWKFLERTDIEVPIRFSRYYSSRPEPFAGAGNWTYSYSRRMVPNGHLLPGRAFDTYLVRDNGTVLSFASEKNKPHKCGNWISRQPGSGSLVGVCGDNNVIQYFVYRSADGEERYDPNGRLSILQRGDGVRLEFQYDSQDKLQSIIDDSGRSLSLSWQGNLVKSVSGSATVSYGIANGRLISVFGGLRDEKYAYDSIAFPSALTAVQNPAGLDLLKINYDPNGLVRETFSLLSPASPVNRFEYSSFSGGIRVRNPLGLLTTIESINKFLYVDGALSNSVKLIVGRDSNCASCGSDGYQSLSYDSFGNRDVSIDFNGNIADSDYSPDGLIRRKVEGKGTPEARTIGFKHERQVESARYTCSGELAECNESSENLVEMVTKRFSDAGGIRPIAECKHDVNLAGARGYICGSDSAAPAGVLQTTYTYCAASDPDFGSMTCPLVGRLKRVDGPRTDVVDVTHYAYYTSNASPGNCSATQCYRKGDLAWTYQSSASSVISYLSYNSRGQPLRIRDANGTVTMLSYDLAGRLLSRTVGGSLFESVDYDSLGQVWRVFAPSGAGTEYCRDQAQRITAEVNVQRGNTSACQGSIPMIGFEAVKYELDAAGNRIREAVVDAAGQEVRVSAQSFTTENRLFESFRAPHSLNPQNSNAKRTTYAYDGNGNLATITDPLGRVTKQEYDSLNRLERVIEDFGVSPSNLNAATIFSYDALSQLRTVEDAEGLITEYIYNGLQRQTEVQSPDAGTQRFTHDGAGNVRSKTDARGVVINYTYDADNRLYHVDYPSEVDASLEYDNVNAICGPEESFAQGRLSRLEDASGTTLFCYDARGNITRKRQVNSGGTMELRYEYGSNDLLSRIHYSSGLVVHYGRDLRGRVSAVNLSRGDLNWSFSAVSDIAYRPNGPLSLVQFAGAQSLSKAWDLNYEPQSVGGSHLNLGYVINDVGLVDSIGGQSYVYDSMYRLEEVKTPAAAMIEKFRYDLIGNRQSFQTPTGIVPYAYAPGSHRLTSVGVLARSYDAAGNTLSGHLPATLSGHVRQAIYDERGRLSEFGYVNARGLWVTEYRWIYNEDGERVATRRVNAAAPETGERGSDFIFDEFGQLLSERVWSVPSSGDPVDRSSTSCIGQACNIESFREVVWVDDVPVAYVLTRGRMDTPEVYFIHSDHLNTPRALTRAQFIGAPVGTLAWEWPLVGAGSSAFGANAAVQHPDWFGAVTRFNLRFPGQQWDPFSGLNYNYLRTYEPASGRYLEPDPIGLYGGVGIYVYSANSALSFFDPYGLSPCGSKPPSGAPPPKKCEPPKGLPKRFRAAARVVLLLWCVMEGKSPPKGGQIKPPPPGPPPVSAPPWPPRD